MLLHHRPVRVKIRLDHHQIFLLKNLLFFELRNFEGLSNKRRRGGNLGNPESGYDMLHIEGPSTRASKTVLKLRTKWARSGSVMQKIWKVGVTGKKWLTTPVLSNFILNFFNI